MCDHFQTNYSRKESFFDRLKAAEKKAGGKENLILSFALNARSESNPYTVVTTSGDIFKFASDRGNGHAFSIVTYTDETVTVENPWYRTQYEISWEDFFKMNPYVDVYYFEN